MAKTKKLRKEKYIKQRIVNGSLYLQVSFTYTDSIGQKQTYNKSINTNDYSSPAQAMDAAVAHRDEMRSLLIYGDTIRPPKDSKHTVTEVFNQIQDVFPKTLKTVKHREITFRNYIQPFVGNKNIEDVAPLDIQMTLNALITTKTDDNIGRVATCWRYIIRTAAFMDYISSDPMMKVVIPKSQKAVKPVDVHTDRETVDQVIDGLIKYTMNNPQMIFDTELIVYLIEVIYYTGIRPAEALGLHRSDVNLSDKYLYVHSAQGSTADEWNTTKATKTKQSIRREPIVPDLAVILDQLLRYQPADQLFQRSSGSVWQIDDVCNKINRVCKKLGIKFTLYQLRHKFSTDLVTANVDPRTIMELMGHNNIKQTLEYARSNDDLKEEALNIRKYS